MRSRTRGRRNARRCSRCARAELESLAASNVADVERSIRLSERAQLVFDFHCVIDGARETALGELKLGTTKRGCVALCARAALR